MKTLAWFGTFVSIIGAFLVASQIVLLGYCFFICGSISLVLVAWLKRDYPQLVLNGTFMLANFWGLWNVV